MNYFGHVALACRFEHSAAFLLGSMLPDFAGIVRCRIPLSSNALISQGVVFHQLSDSVFHELPVFRAMVQDSVAELVRVGIRKGPARAVAHIGIELLLDAALAPQPEAKEAFRLALSAASPRRLGEQLRWSDAKAAQRFEDLRLRLLERAVTRHNHAIEVITARLIYALAKRPRLQLTVAEQVIVETWLRATAPRVDGYCASLWLALVRCVSSRWSDYAQGAQPDPPD